MQKQTFFDETCCFSGTSWQCFTMFCDIQQEMIILAGTDKCLTSPKMNSIHFEGRRSLQTTKKNVWLTQLHAMSVLTLDSPGTKFRSRCYTVLNNNNNARVKVKRINPKFKKLLITSTTSADKVRTTGISIRFVHAYDRYVDIITNTYGDQVTMAYCVSKCVLYSPMQITDSSQWS